MTKKKRSRRQADFFESYQESTRLFIRKRLKECRMTYRDLAKRLGISETSVKRMMTTQEIRISELAEIAAILEFELVSPIQFLSKERVKFLEYTEEQEDYFAREPRGAHLYLRLLVGDDFETACARTRLSREVALRHLFELERRKALELWPGDRVRVKLSGPFRWRSGGKFSARYGASLENTILRYLRETYPEAPFTPPDAGYLWSFECHMSKHTGQEFLRALYALVYKYRVLAVQEFKSGIPTEPVSAVIGADFLDAWTQVYSEAARLKK